MFEAASCENFNDAYNPADGFELPFLLQPFCPANVRRQHTRDRLTKKSRLNTVTASLRTATAISSMKIVGKKLYMGSEVRVSSASRKHCRRLFAFDDELQSSPCTPHSDSATIFVGFPTVCSSMLKANGNKRCNCYDDDEPCNCRQADERPYFVNDHPPCQTCQQQEPFHNENDRPDECFQIYGVEPEISQNSTGTYSNARIDKNRLLKLLRKFDTIRQRTRAAREACLLRFEKRQKQRLHLPDCDFKYQQKGVGTDFCSNEDKSPSLENDKFATAAARWNDIGMRGAQVDVKLCDTIDACSPERSNNLVTTWPPLLDDETTKEPRDAVITRLMSQFESIRLDSVTARLENQKRFEIKRKQRKCKI